MTDKEKIREEVARIQAYTQSDVLKEVLDYIDKVQEEPKFKTGDHIKPIDSSLGAPRTIFKVCDGWYVTNQGTLDFEFEDNWELAEEPVSEEWIEELRTKLVKRNRTMSKKEELIDKMAAAIAKIKEETNKGVIKEHMISPIVNWKTGEETGQAAVLTCGTKFEYTDDVLKRWKEQLGASDYRIKVNRSQLFITFVAYYKKDD